MASHHSEMGTTQFRVTLGHHHRIFDHVFALIRQPASITARSCFSNLSQHVIPEVFKK
jgi:hypothetical protein